MRPAFVVLVLTAAACSAGDAGPTASSASTPPPLETTTNYGTAPPVPVQPPSAQVDAAVERVLDGVLTTDWDVESVGELADLGDARTAWLLADLMRFYQTGPPNEALILAFTALTGANQDVSEVSFVWASNHLIAWDLPAWDGYPSAKRQIFGPLEDTWDRFFEEDHGIDWRPVTWGGVAPDTRPLDENTDCGCIPALDHPATTDAEGGDWYPDRDVVFGVVVGGEAIGLPKNQMEVHEMVHLTLGGREIAIPYCTLCGSAQAYYVDDVPGIDRAVLRTSGLLSRSNKLMYDLTTGSAIDTFTGEALSGSLAADGVTLEQVSVVASTWGDWKDAHPDTRIVAEDGGIGRTYIEDPLGGRDAAGPIFPVGDIDPRLPGQERVVGAIGDDGTPVAFPVGDARAELAKDEIQFAGLTARLEDAIRIYDSDGSEVVSHESFWFAWSQFHQGTLLWSPEG